MENFQEEEQIEQKNQADEMGHLTEPSVAEPAASVEVGEDKENHQACSPSSSSPNRRFPNLL